MNIRKATPDDQLQIAPLVYTAIHEIAYSLTGTSDRQHVLESTRDVDWSAWQPFELREHMGGRIRCDDCRYPDCVSW
ncbi:hypothetical protein [Exiguobacterium mexicanum]|uniref:hypothetical protein n=1 Tax=Exiguobacterium mexicanum TaxID=340146 RepID=UPI0037BFF99C